MPASESTTSPLINGFKDFVNSNKIVGFIVFLVLIHVTISYARELREATFKPVIGLLFSNSSNQVQDATVILEDFLCNTLVFIVSLLLIYLTVSAFGIKMLELNNSVSPMVIV